MDQNRNFTSISPSARSLLMMKGHTNIPFARETAELLSAPLPYVPDFTKKDLTFWARVLHFESRYWSIDQLIAGLPSTNILELSSGFSFRSLEYTRMPGYYYIDTDLPDVIEEKKAIIKVLQIPEGTTKGCLELAPLNCLNRGQFSEIVSHFPEGQIIIVNEGLLMYLGQVEKENICRIIHENLKKRGGYWITADIYIRNQSARSGLEHDRGTREFFEKHNIEENKFESYEEAESFFHRMGFRINKIAKVKWSDLSSAKYFIRSMSIKQLLSIRKSGKMHATWRLEIL